MEKIIKGFKINSRNCVKKLAERQKGDPANLISEVIDNLLDEYIIQNYPYSDRFIHVHSNEKDMISISNKCVGLSAEDLQNLKTIGGTAKKNAEQPLHGIRGIGVLTAVNPELVESLSITFFYIPIQAYRRILFYWDKECLYFDTVKPSSEENPFTCEYRLKLIKRDSLQRLECAIQSRLRYLPSPSYFNGKSIESIFSTCRYSKTDKSHYVAISPKVYGDVDYEVLYGFKHIRSFYGTLTLIHGGYNKTDHSLDEYIDGFFNKRFPTVYPKIEFPFVSSMRVICNSDNLNLTTSKEHIYLDYDFLSLIKFVKTAMLNYLLLDFDSLLDEHILSNLYIFKRRLVGIMSMESINEDDPEETFISKLLHKGIWQILNSNVAHSLKEVYTKIKESGNPLFYSIRGNNLNFAYGRFQHDFILTVSRTLSARCNPAMFDYILAEVFTSDNLVNLDNIFYQPDKIKQLVDRGIVNEEDLFPRVQFKATRDLATDEVDFISAITGFFNQEQVKQIIGRILYFDIEQIKIGLYEVVNGDTGVLNASFFDAEGEFLLLSHVSNFKLFQDQPPGALVEEELELALPQKIFLGLNRGSVELRYIIRNYSDQPIEYSLMYVCNQLVSTQKYIDPDSMLYYRIRNELLSEMWDYLIQNGGA